MLYGFAACAGADIQESPGGLGHLDAQGDPAVPQLCQRFVGFLSVFP